MTAPAQAPAAPPAAPGHRGGFGHLVLAELTKIRTVRSTVWSFLLLVVLTIGFTVLITALTVAGWAKADAATRAQIAGDPVASILGIGLGFGTDGVIKDEIGVVDMGRIFDHRQAVDRDMGAFLGDGPFDDGALGLRPAEVASE